MKELLGFPRALLLEVRKLFGKRPVIDALCIKQRIGDCSQELILISRRRVSPDDLVHEGQGIS